MKIGNASSGFKLSIARNEWVQIGKKAGWVDSEEDADIVRTAKRKQSKRKKKRKKKKDWDPNPWAVCTKSVGRKNKEKYERCVQKVKKQQR